MSLTYTNHAGCQWQDTLGKVLKFAEEHVDTLHHQGDCFCGLMKLRSNSLGGTWSMTYSTVWCKRSLQPDCEAQRREHWFGTSWVYQGISKNVRVAVSWLRLIRRCVNETCE